MWLTSGSAGVVSMDTLVPDCGASVTGVEVSISTAAAVLGAKSGADAIGLKMKQNTYICKPTVID